MISFGSLYRRLYEYYGPQHWWPAGSPFEIMLGAVLVQRTTWDSAASALRQLQQRDLLAPGPLAQASRKELEACVRGAGFFRAKARRIQLLAGFVNESGCVASLAQLDTVQLRESLLSQEGIGPETADAILLYAFERPAVVVDAYLRRLTARLAGTPTPPSDPELRERIQDQISRTSELTSVRNPV